MNEKGSPLLGPCQTGDRNSRISVSSPQQT